MAPTVSVIVPAYNGGRYVTRCLKSLCNQSFNDIEIVVVDDGSTDNTASAVAGLMAADKRIKMLAHDRTCGEGAARRTGILAAQGKYIAFLDTDDIFYRDAVASLYNAARQYDCDITVGASRLYFSHLHFSIGHYPGAGHPMFSQGLVSGREGTQALLEAQDIQCVCWDKLYRASLLKEIEVLPDVSVGPDFLINLSVFPKACRIGSTYTEVCRWTYNGMGSKYYLLKWEEYLRSAKAAHSLIGTMRTDTPDISVTAMYEWLGKGILNNLRESCVQRILHGYKDEEILTVIRDTCREFDFVPDTDAVLFLAESRRHLRNHRKFYNFTRLINLLS